MTEKNPQFSYSPEGILQFNVELAEDELADVQQGLLDQLNDAEGIEALSDGQVTVNVKEAFDGEFGYQPGERLNNFLDNIHRLIPYSPDSEADQVSYAQFVSQRGLVATTYPSLQQWLNSEEPTSEVAAKEVITAMALPFGKEYETTAKTKFRMAHNGAEALHFMYALQSDDFDLYQMRKTDEHHIEQNGSTTWNTLSIATVGNCACLGVEATDRRSVAVGEQTIYPWLYEMRPHNIDIPQQALSLILGVGAVAYRASQYEGTEDVLESINWGEERRYPLI